MNSVKASRFLREALLGSDVSEETTDQTCKSFEVIEQGLKVFPYTIRSIFIIQFIANLVPSITDELFLYEFRKKINELFQSFYEFKGFSSEMRGSDKVH